MSKSGEVGNNPHDAGTPEWQLFENMTSQRSLERRCIADAGRHQVKAAEARKRGAAFESALAVLALSKASQP